MCHLRTYDISGPGAQRLGSGLVSAPAARHAGDPLAALMELDGVADAVQESRQAMDRLHLHRVLRRQTPTVAAESSLRGARAAAALSGVDIPLAELRSSDASDPVVRGAVRAYGALGPMVATWTRAPGQVLAKLHALAAADLVPVDRLGRPQQGPEVGRRLAGLAQLVSDARTTPAVVLSGVVHGELAGLSAFGSADRMVALAAARLTLRSRALDTNAVSVPEVGVLDSVADYPALLAGFMDGSPAGLAAWLCWWAAAVTSGAVEGLAICESLARAG